MLLLWVLLWTYDPQHLEPCLARSIWWLSTNEDIWWSVTSAECFQQRGSIVRTWQAFFTLIRNEWGRHLGPSLLLKINSKINLSDTRRKRSWGVIATAGTYAHSLMRARHLLFRCHFGQGNYLGGTVTESYLEYGSNFSLKKGRLIDATSYWNGVFESIQVAGEQE